TVVSQPEQVGYLVPEFAVRYLPDVYMGQQISGAFEVTATRGTSTREWDDGRGSFATPAHDPANVLDPDPHTRWEGLDWPGETNEFAALNMWFDAPKKVGT